MMNAGWVWVHSNLAMKISGWLYLRPLLPSDGMQAFAEQVSKYTESHFGITTSADSVDVPYSVALYNSIMLYAHAATRVLSAGGTWTMVMLLQML